MLRHPFTVIEKTTAQITELPKSARMISKNGCGSSAGKGCDCINGTTTVKDDPRKGMAVMMRWQPWYIVPFPKVNEQVNP
ncbi:hypothetical protein [Desulfobulbus propionicus]|jgi:hypothetical protein|uniref:hypothetical protein n=1 Tax=Desulfobulbus propionicus TaxID=894 RepID=UPI00146B8A8D|nr:hypothetical protein [Desulfobulbus propionicus]